MSKNFFCGNYWYLPDFNARAFFIASIKKMPMYTKVRFEQS